MDHRRIDISGDAAALPEGLAGASVEAARPPAREVLTALARAGAAELSVALHGARPAIHDWHTEDGSFAATLASLTTARSLGIPTAVRTPITRSNARVLGELPPLLRARDVRRWALSWPEAEGDDWTARVTRLGLGVPAALAAVARAESLGIEVRLCGIPLCVVGPYADRVVPSAPRAYGERCGGCRARAACGGVDAVYLARFGEGELRAL